MLFIPNMIVYYVAIYLIGFTHPLKGIISFTHLMEFMPGRVSGLGAKMLFVEGMIQVVSPLVLMFVTKDTQIFLWIPFGINIVAALCFIVFYIPESIKWTLDKGHFD